MCHDGQVNIELKTLDEFNYLYSVGVSLFLTIQNEGSVKHSSSMSKLRASLMRGSARLVQKLTSSHGAAQPQESADIGR